MSWYAVGSNLPLRKVTGPDIIFSELSLVTSLSQNFLGWTSYHKGQFIPESSLITSLSQTVSWTESDHERQFNPVVFF